MALFVTVFFTFGIFSMEMSMYKVMSYYVYHFKLVGNLLDDNHFYTDLREKLV